MKNAVCRNRASQDVEVSSQLCSNLRNYSEFRVACTVFELDDATSVGANLPRQILLAEITQLPRRFDLFAQKDLPRFLHVDYS